MKCGTCEKILEGDGWNVHNTELHIRTCREKNQTVSQPRIQSYFSKKSKFSLEVDNDLHTPHMNDIDTELDTIDGVETSETECVNNIAKVDVLEVVCGYGPNVYEYNEFLLNNNNNIASKETQAGARKCQGYLPLEFKSSVRKSFLFQLYLSQKNIPYVFENGYFHSQSCHSRGYLIGDHDNNIVDETCMQLKYSTALNKILLRTLGGGNNKPMH